MCKTEGVYSQFKPMIVIDSKPIPPINIGSSFKYLGKMFNFEMDNELIKNDLTQKISSILRTTSSLKATVNCKLKILRSYLPSQVNFDLQIYDLSPCWVTSHIDAMIVNTVRDWLRMPVSSCVAEVLFLPLAKGGLGVPSLRQSMEKLRMLVRCHLKYHPSSALRDIWSLTSAQNVPSDWRLVNQDLKAAKNQITNEYIDSNLSHLSQLQIQGAALNELNTSVPKNEICRWSKILLELPDSTLRFARKAILSQLPTASNLHRWGRSLVSTCPLCSGIQTNKHVFSNCSSSNTLKRYTSRHNQVLLIIHKWLTSSITGTNFKILTDLNNSVTCNENQVFKSFRPDVVILDGSKSITTLELTVCHETNIKLARERKTAKYRNLFSDLHDKYSNYTLKQFFIEVSVLGIISDLSEFIKSFKINPIPDSVKHEITALTIKSSQRIYWLRNSNEDVNIEIF